MIQWRKLIAFNLVLVMLFTMVPLHAFAENIPSESEQKAELQLQFTQNGIIQSTCSIPTATPSDTLIAAYAEPMLFLRGQQFLTGFHAGESPYSLTLTLGQLLQDIPDEAVLSLELLYETLPADSAVLYYSLEPGRTHGASDAYNGKNYVVQPAVPGAPGPVIPDTSLFQSQDGMDNRSVSWCTAPHSMPVYLAGDRISSEACPLVLFEHLTSRPLVSLLCATADQTDADGAPVYSQNRYLLEEGAPLPDHPALSTLAFLGWNTCVDGSGTWYPAGSPVSSAMDQLLLYAVFGSQVELDPGYDNLTRTPCPVINNRYILPETEPIRPGYFFNGWYALVNNVKIRIHPYDEAIADVTCLHADWTADDHKSLAFYDGDVLLDWFSLSDLYFRDGIETPLQFMIPSAAYEKKYHVLTGLSINGKSYEPEAPFQAIFQQEQEDHVLKISLQYKVLDLEKSYLVYYPDPFYASAALPFSFVQEFDPTLVSVALAGSDLFHYQEYPELRLAGWSSDLSRLNPNQIEYHPDEVIRTDLLSDWNVLFSSVKEGQSAQIPITFHTIGWTGPDSGRYMDTLTDYMSQGVPIGPDEMNAVLYPYSDWHFFLGWNTKEDGTGTWYSPYDAVIPELKNAELYTVLGSLSNRNVLKLIGTSSRSSVSAKAANGQPNLLYNIEFTADGSAILPDALFRSPDGSLQTGWQDSAGREFALQDTVPLSAIKDQVLYPAFQKKIPLELGYDDLTYGFATIQNDQYVLPDIDPIRKGYMFQGWYAQCDGKEIKIEPHTWCRSSINHIYAKWIMKLDSYVLSFYDNDLLRFNFELEEKTDAPIGSLLIDYLTMNRYHLVTGVKYQDTVYALSTPISQFLINAEYGSQIRLDLQSRQLPPGKYHIFYSIGSEDRPGGVNEVDQSSCIMQSFTNNQQFCRFPAADAFCYPADSGYQLHGWSRRYNGSLDYRPNEEIRCSNWSVFFDVAKSYAPLTLTYHWLLPDAQTYEEIVACPALGELIGNHHLLQFPETYPYSNSHLFLGWNTRSNGNGTWYSPADPVTQDMAQMDLYTILVKRPQEPTMYLIGSSLDAQQPGGRNLDDMPNQILPISRLSDGTILLPDETFFTEHGYPQVGWNVCGSEYSLGEALDSDSTFLCCYALYGLPVTLSVDPSSSAISGFITASGVHASAEDWDIRPGYQFLSWNTAPDGSGLTIDNLQDLPQSASQPLTLYAQWKDDLHTAWIRTYESQNDTAGMLHKVCEPTSPSFNNQFASSSNLIGSCASDSDLTLIHTLQDLNPYPCNVRNFLTGYEDEDGTFYDLDSKLGELVRPGEVKNLWALWASFSGRQLCCYGQGGLTSNGETHLLQSIGQNGAATLPGAESFHLRGSKLLGWAKTPEDARCGRISYAPGSTIYVEQQAVYAVYDKNLLVVYVHKDQDDLLGHSRNVCNRFCTDPVPENASSSNLLVHAVSSSNLHICSSSSSDLMLCSPLYDLISEPNDQHRFVTGFETNSGKFYSLNKTLNDVIVQGRPTELWTQWRLFSDRQLCCYGLEGMTIANRNYLLVDVDQNQKAVLPGADSFHAEGRQLIGWADSLYHACSGIVSYAPGAVINVGSLTTMYAVYDSDTALIFVHEDQADTEGTLKLVHTGACTPQSNTVSSSNLTFCSPLQALLPTHPDSSRFLSGFQDKNGTIYALNEPIRTVLGSASSVDLWATWISAYRSQLCCYGMEGLTDAGQNYILLNMQEDRRVQLPGFDSFHADGKILLGWADTAEEAQAGLVRYAPGALITVDQQTSLYAVFGINAITFYSNETQTADMGSREAITTKNYPQPGRLHSINSLFDHSLVFIGWNTDRSGNGSWYSPFDAVTRETPTALYAQWSKIPASPYYILQSSDPSYSFQGPFRQIISADTALPTHVGEAAVFYWDALLRNMGHTHCLFAPADRADNLNSHTMLQLKAVDHTSADLLGMLYGNGGQVDKYASVIPIAHYSNASSSNLKPLLTDYTTIKKPGSVLVSWNTQADGSGTDYAVTEQTEQVLRSEGGTTGVARLYAQWLDVQTLDSPVFVYHGNGGKTADGRSYVVSYNRNTVEPALFTLDELQFVGWNTEPDGSGLAYLPGQNLQFSNFSSGTPLYAQWATSKTIYHWGSEQKSIRNQENSTVWSYPVQWNPQHGLYVAGWNTRQDGSGRWFTQGEPLPQPAPTELYLQTIDPHTAAPNQCILKSYPTGNILINGVPSGGLVFLDRSPDGTLVLPEVSGSPDFIGWQLDMPQEDSTFRYSPSFGPQLLVQPGTKTAVEAGAVLQAFHAPHTIYDGNGGVSSEPPEADKLISISSSSSSNLTIFGSNTFKKSQYTLKSWNTEKDGSGVSYPCSTILDSAQGPAVLYAQWSRMPSMVSGTVAGNGRILANCNVQLVQGGKTICGTMSDQNGRYRFDDVPCGLYNLIVEKNGVTNVAQIGIIDTTEEAPVAFNKSALTSLNVEKGFPGLVIDGLQQEASQQQEQSGSHSKLNLQMTIQSANPAVNQDAAVIQHAAQDHNHLTLLQLHMNTTQNNQTAVISQTTAPLVLTIPITATHFHGFTVYQSVDGQLRRLPEYPAEGAALMNSSKEEYYILHDNTLELHVYHLAAYGFTFSDGDAPLAQIETVNDSQLSVHVQPCTAPSVLIAAVYGSDDQMLSIGQCAVSPDQIGQTVSLKLNTSIGERIKVFLAEPNSLHPISSSDVWVKTK